MENCCTEDFFSYNVFIGWKDEYPITRLDKEVKWLAIHKGGCNTARGNGTRQMT
jgi:hypothetical protein